MRPRVIVRYSGFDAARRLHFGEFVFEGRMYIMMLGISFYEC